MRGFFGIGIEAGKTPDNIGGLFRSAHAFGAAFIFTIGHRYPDRYQATDTTKADRHIPLLTFADFADFYAHAPRDVEVIGVEQTMGSVDLGGFTHPDRAVYVLGAEDHGLSDAAIAGCDRLVEIPTAYCLNVATAGSIVLYDRVAKAGVLAHA
jgi:tRNA G18 (ribose-2'-O)-methylase SpoU